ncbi:patatin [Paenibacillus sambharensis]|uniref:Patatin n=1 Tax=Paenibacillus sambharensis TaxID=1803190 RepID=A0A2W1L5L2_9BACL|nr:patatin-like phospholipase family protein [Paenibacillus sambharensis]PZD93420.1 patatin [Paenibacillus sambharensis]
MKINAVFEGGGVKGIALAGAVYAAEQRGIAFNRLAGTSSGSIVASLLAAGYSAAELKMIIGQTPYRQFLKRSRMSSIRWIGPAARLMIRKGLYSGEALEYWMRRLLLERGIRTFEDLPKGRLTIVASDISNGRILVLPDDIVMYGGNPMKMEVARAVRMSTSIPFFFDPVILRLKSPLQKPVRGELSFGHRFAYIVDGGLLSNFPLWLFDGSEGGKPASGGGIVTIGFQLVGKNDNEPREIRGPLSMFQAIFETMMQAHDERYIEKQYRSRTVKIPTLGVRSTQFDLNEELSEKLFNAGLQQADAFFDRYFPLG